MAEDKNIVEESAVNDIYPLVDEDGNTTDFRLIDVFEIEQQRYVVMQPCDMKNAGVEMAEDEAIIFRLNKDENGEEVFAYIEDDKEWDLVVNTYNDMLFDEN